MSSWKSLKFLVSYCLEKTARASQKSKRISKVFINKPFRFNGVPLGLNTYRIRYEWAHQMFFAIPFYFSIFLLNCIFGL